MEYDIQIEKVVDTIPLAVVRRRATRQELSKVIPNACGLVWNVLRSQKIKGGRHIAVYLDDEIHLEVGVEMDAPFAGHGEVVGSSLPTGLVARTTHFGPYGGLGAAHTAIHNWCAGHGQALAGPNWEIYGHWEDEWNQNPSKILTDVFYLLKTDGGSNG